MLLKLSGEAFAGERKLGVDPDEPLEQALGCGDVDVARPGDERDRLADRAVLVEADPRREDVDGAALQVEVAELADRRGAQTE